MMGGAKAHYDVVAFSQTDFTEDLKKITVPVHKARSGRHRHANKKPSRRWPDLFALLCGDWGGRGHSGSDLPIACRHKSS